MRWFGIGAVAGGVGVAAMRVTGTYGHPFGAGLVSLQPLMLVVLVLTAMLLAFRRQWVAWGAVLLVCIPHAIWLGQQWGPGPTTGGIAADGSEAFVLVTANVGPKNDQILEVIEAIVAVDADIVVLQELSPGALRQIERSGLVDAFEARLLDPQTTGYGTGVFSRLDIVDGLSTEIGGGRLSAARVSVRGGQDFQLLNVHISSPRSGLDAWRRELMGIGGMVAERQLPVVVAGDFNSTTNHREFRSLLDEGLTDSHRAAGSGLGLSWVLAGVPVLRIDHVLVSAEFTVLSSSTLEIPGSDHRALVSQLVLD